MNKGIQLVVYVTQRNAVYPLRKEGIDLKKLIWKFENVANKEIAS